MIARRIVAAMLAVWAAPAAVVDAGAAAGARRLAAQEAPRDTTVGGYLRSLSDSTDAYFGPVAAPYDSTGLDSARVRALSQFYGRERERRRMSFFPVLSFNRVDGPVLGGGLTIGRPGSTGKLDGRLAAATGPNLLLGHASYLKHLDREDVRWSLRLSGGRRTATMSRESIEPRLTALRAFVNGSDRNHYLQRDGVEAKLSREGATHRLGVAYRDMLEAPRSTTATWNLEGDEPDVVGNLPAWRGHAHEFEFEALWRLPRTPITAQIVQATSSRSAGSDFEYRRTIVSAAADIGVGRTFAIVPQLAYGALNGEALPQESFYLGGSRSLRAIPGESLGGTRAAVARGDVIVVRDLLAMAHLPHSAAFPLQGSVFGALGSAWGTDPYGGPTRSGGDWPDEEDWRSEVGFALMYQPGIPDPEQYLRLNFAFPLGPGGDDYRVSLSVTRAVDLVRPFER